MSSDLLKHAAEIVEAYVSNNEVQAKELPNLLKEVFGALTILSVGGVEEMPEEIMGMPLFEEEAKVAPRVEKKKPVPFMDADQAISHDAIFCLICGKSCKALKGHLTRSHKMDCDQYRKMFDLDKTYPMVSPAYSERRRTLAIEAGLGEKLRESRKKSVLEAE